MNEDELHVTHDRAVEQLKEAARMALDALRTCDVVDCGIGDCGDTVFGKSYNEDKVADAMKRLVSALAKFPRMVGQ